MSTHRVLGLAAAVLAAAALTGCVVPTGPMSSASPEIGDVTAVVLDTSGELTIAEGEPSLTIHAPEGILDVLTAEVRDGVLELGRRPGVMLPGGVRISYELTLRSLEGLEINGSGDISSTVADPNLTIEINGSGDVEVDGIDGDSVAVRIAGSGDVELAGAAQTLQVDIDGTGDVDLDGLEVRDAGVAISGSGDVRLHVTGTLTAEIDGSGSVRHRGGATVDADVSGSGEVSAED